jgi:hypothetical protein
MSYKNDQNIRTESLILAQVSKKEKVKHLSHGTLVAGQQIAEGLSTFKVGCGCKFKLYFNHKSISGIHYAS